MGNYESAPNEEAPKTPPQTHKKSVVTRRMKDPITDKIMTMPTMVLSSMKIYDHVTITKWLESGRSYDPLTGIPISIPQSPMLLVARMDIKQKIDYFLSKNPQYKSLVIDENDESIEWNSLFKYYDEQSQKKYAKLTAEQEILKTKAKQIFKPFKMESELKENDTNDEKNETDDTGIEYDASIVLQADIPVVCIMGPSRNGKSTIINDILGVKDATTISMKSNVALTKGGWIALYSKKNQKDDIEENKEEIKTEEFYLLDMEGLSHQVTTFTKRLFYACYATANLVVWNDKEIASDRFINLMEELKDEMKAVATSDEKPAFLYLKRDGGDFSFDPYDTFDEYINKDDSFKWFRNMNIFSSISAYELDRPMANKNNRKAPLNFHDLPQNYALLQPLIKRLKILAQNSKRFSSNMFTLQQQINNINSSSSLSMTKKAIANNETLKLFLIAPSSDASRRHRDMIYVADKFDWDHEKLDNQFKLHMNNAQDTMDPTKISSKIIEELTATEKEIYERVKNKIDVVSKAEEWSALALTGVGTSGAMLAGTEMVAAVVAPPVAAAAVITAAGLAYLGGWHAGRYSETGTIGGYYPEYSLGRTDEEMRLDKEKATEKTEVNMEYIDDEDDIWLYMY